MTPGPQAPSYRALFALPSMSHIVASLFLSRTAQAMSGVALTLFTLAEFGSATLAGLVAFASFAPGILISPIAGALLDRHGRVRLIGLDFTVGLLAMASIGVLSLADALTPELLVGIAVVMSLTYPLSMTGLRTVFPLIVPKRLWERANALDSNAFVTSTTVGPLAAAGAIALFGPALAMVAVAIPYGLAVLALRGVRVPGAAPDTGRPILRSAWDGLRYVWRNQTLRGLAIAMSVRTFAGGIVVIVVPLIVLRQLGGSELAVGFALALAGLAGMISVAIVGRIDSRGRERLLMAAPIALTGVVMGLLLFPAGSFGPAPAVMGFLVVCLVLVLMGVFDGPLDIGLFTLRQRRTSTAWLGRAFAISMAVNAMGYPVGSAIAGVISESSLSLAIGVAVVTCLIASGLVVLLVPRHDPDAEHDGQALEAVSPAGAATARPGP